MDFPRTFLTQRLRTERSSIAAIAVPTRSHSSVLHLAKEDLLDFVSHFCIVATITAGSMVILCLQLPSRQVHSYLIMTGPS